MAIQLTTGDLLKQDDVDAIVNTVNCVGVMGKGIALQFKNKWPANFKAYAAACRAGLVRPGRMFVHDSGGLVKPHYLINFPTKDHWRSPSRIEFIRDGLIDLVAQVRRLDIRSIAIPPLGCGNGGLDWTQVRPLIEAAFAPLPDLEIRLFGPGAPPEAKSMEVHTRRPGMTPGRAAMLKLQFHTMLRSEQFASEIAQASWCGHRVLEDTPRLFFHRQTTVGGAPAQPFVGLFVDWSEAQGWHGVSAPRRGERPSRGEGDREGAS